MMMGILCLLNPSCVIGLNGDTRIERKETGRRGRNPEKKANFRLCTHAIADARNVDVYYVYDGSGRARWVLPGTLRQYLSRYSRLFLPCRCNRIQNFIV